MVSCADAVTSAAAQIAVNVLRINSFSFIDYKEADSVSFFIFFVTMVINYSFLVILSRFSGETHLYFILKNMEYPDFMAE